MRLTDVQRTNPKDVVLTIRANNEDVDWLKEHDVSPSLLFTEALKELKTQVNAQKEVELNLSKFASPKKK